jgi:hypothetical protein
MPANNVSLDDVAMVAAGEGWAVGGLRAQWPSASPGQGPAGVLYHLTNGTWQRLPRVYPGAELTALSMGAPNDGWAASTYALASAGADTANHVLVLHYSGGRWTPVDIPALDAVLNGPPGSAGGTINQISIQMFGPESGWMFALTNLPRDPSIPTSQAEVIILRYEQGAWTPIATPAVTVTTQVFGLSAVSANEAWTVGTDYGAGADFKVVIAHYVNGAWSLWPKTFAGNSDQDITMLSPTDGWAAYDSNGSLETALLHYDGSAWAPVATPAEWTPQQVFLTHLVYALNSDVTWFGAATDVPNSLVPQPLLKQYAHGQWEGVSWPFSTVEPQALAAGSGDELWGIGDINHQEGCPPGAVVEIAQGVFLHYRQGSWSREVLP